MNLACCDVNPFVCVRWKGLGAPVYSTSMDSPHADLGETNRRVDALSHA